MSKPGIYTILRTKEHIKEIEQVRNILKNQIEYNCKSYTADSKIYRMLPKLYINAVKKIHEQDLAIQELTAKVNKLQKLQMHFSSIIEICEGKNDNR